MKSALLAIALFALPLATSAAKGKSNRAAPLAAAPSSPPSSAARAGGTSGRPFYPDTRGAPPMDPKREVNEQDCTKPIDLSAGNLRCK